jgi:hypothetical protein
MAPTAPHNLCIFLKNNTWKNIRANEKSVGITFERRTRHFQRFAFQNQTATSRVFDFSMSGK